MIPSYIIYLAFGFLVGLVIYLIKGEKEDEE